MDGRMIPGVLPFRLYSLLVGRVWIAQTRNHLLNLAPILSLILS